MKLKHTNTVCPYCRQIMNRIPDHPLSRSREHLVPNTLLQKPRTNGDFEFWACKGCNSDKSNLDFILGTVAKSQSECVDLAVNAFIKAVDYRGSQERFLDMIRSGKKMPDGSIALKIPVSGLEMAKYCTYLGQGAYFLKNGIPMSKSMHIVLFEVFNSHVAKELEHRYRQQWGTNAYRDLEQNSYTRVFAPGEAIMWMRNGQVMFVFHDRFVLILRIVRRTKANLIKLDQCSYEFYR